MSNSLKYSIIYAVIRPEISERVSVGLIIVDGDSIDIRYSRQKLNAIQPFFSEKEYKLLSRVVVSMNESTPKTSCFENSPKQCFHFDRNACQYRARCQS